MKTMKVRAVRSFISAHRGLDNVALGSVVDVDEAYGKNLIAHGLAEEVSARPRGGNGAPVSFIRPIGVSPVSGSSLPAGQVSGLKTATPSGSGARKTKGAKSQL